jgi:type I restriction enzyme S subunit
MSGWVRVALGRVTSKIGSGATPLGGEAAYQAHGISLIRSLNVHDGEFRRKDLAFLSQEQADGLANVVVQPGDVLLNITGASVARCCEVPEGVLPARVNQHVAIIRPHADRLSPQFLRYLLVSSKYKHRLLSAGDGAGATRQALTKAQLQEFLVEFPESLKEQHRIVAILDEAFEGIATAKANAEKNLQSASELFARYLQAIFSAPRPSWIASTLGATYDVRDGTHDSPKYHDRGRPLITSKNLRPEGLSFDDVKLIADADYRKINQRSAVHKGDVLFAMIGTIGNPTVVEVEPDFAIKNVALFKVSKGQSGHYLRYYLSSQGVVSRMQSEAKGTTQKFVGLGYLRAFPVTVPSPVEQLSLVRELDDLAAETGHLESIYPIFLSYPYMSRRKRRLHAG